MLGFYQHSADILWWCELQRKAIEFSGVDFMEVGKQIQMTLDDGNFTQKISIKDKVKNLSTLRKKVKVKDTMVLINNLVLFNRLSLLAERNLSAKEGLRYELTAVPMSLFDEKFI